MLSMKIADRLIGYGNPTFIIAEMSANHNQNFEEAVRLVHVAKDCGADAIKLQTYTPDTLTIDCDNEYFKIRGTIWKGETLYNLYKKAFTPWEWQPKLKEIADEIGIILFSTPFDKSSVDFLEEMDVPAYKIASFEIVDLPLIEYVSQKGKPIIISTGMAEMDEVREAVEVAKQSGTHDIALLKCTSAYPAEYEDMNLRTIPDMEETFRTVVGLSDHSAGITVPIASVTLGATIIEKHFTLSRDKGGPDAVFSLEPEEFKRMVEAVRSIENALGSVHYGPVEHEKKSLAFRRSLFVVKDMKCGEQFHEENVRSIRPGYGLPPRLMRDILGRKASKDIKRGTPLSWDLITN